MTCRLGDEFLALREGVVFFLVHVGQFHAVDEQLRPGRDVLACLGADEGFGKRRHADWMVGYEYWGG